MTTQNDKAIEELRKIDIDIYAEYETIDDIDFVRVETIERVINDRINQLQQLKQSVSTDADAKEGGVRYASIEGVEEKAKQILADHKEGFKYLKDK